MKKMSTLFVVNYENNKRGEITTDVRDENRWVFEDTNNVKFTQKFDGTACAIIDGVLYKRYDAKHGKLAPEGAIPCGEPDIITGHHPHWVKVDANKPEDRYFIEALENYKLQIEIHGYGLVKLDSRFDGTYEMCGEKVGVNAEKITGHTLLRHGRIEIKIPELTFDGIRQVLETLDIEGIVFHHNDGRMCKIRKTDFGFKR